MMGSVQNTAPEQWLPVVGYEGLYEVSDLGRVRSVDRVVIDSRGRELKLKSVVLRGGPSASGRLTVNLCRDGAQTNKLIYQLVAEAFLGPRPQGMEVCHGPGGNLDDRAVNLRWDTHSGNTHDMVKDGTHNNARKTHCKRGHPLSGDNVKITSAGSRQCRECQREAVRRCKARNKAAAAARQGEGVII